MQQTEINSFDISDVTRVTIVDHSRIAKFKGTEGRVYENMHVEKIELQLQDDNKTLKIFIS
jgi:hypothetical protein